VPKFIPCKVDKKSSVRERKAIIGRKGDDSGGGGGMSIGELWLQSRNSKRIQKKETEASCF